MLANCERESANISLKPSVDLVELQKENLEKLA